MAAFSDPEVMAALQDGMFLVSHTTRVSLLSSSASYLLWYQNNVFVNSGAMLHRFLLVI